MKDLLLFCIENEVTIKIADNGHGIAIIRMTHYFGPEIRSLSYVVEVDPHDAAMNEQNAVKTLTTMLNAIKNHP